ncbi:DEAD/DEAH box helicase family protein, partial [Rhodoplanes roseus]
ASSAAAGSYGRLAFSHGGRGTQWVMSRVAPHVALRLKSVFPRIDKATTGRFCFDDSPIVCADLDWFLSRYPMDMTAADRRRLTRERHRFETSRAEFETILLPDWRPAARTSLRADRRAFAFQEKAIEIAVRMRRLLVLDEGGMGKTITGTGIMVRAGLFPAAVVVQAHLASQWAERIAEFSTLRVHVIKSTTPYELPEADVYVFRYSNIAGWVDIAGQGVFRVVLFDEIQELRRGGNAQKGKAGKVFVRNAAIRVGLTATPIYNYGDE